MEQVDPNPTRRRGLWATLAIVAVTSASVVTIASPGLVTVANADPQPAPPAPATTTASPAPGAPATAPPPAAQGPAGQPAPGDPNAPPPPPLDPNALPPPVADRIANPVGGFSYILPPGWVESDASHLDYGSALLSKTTGPPPMPNEPPPVANDTRVVLGRLDAKLYASAEADNGKAALRLGSDMGEFFMPYPGTRINQETAPLNGNGLTGSASYYEVKFNDPAKPNGQIWTGVIGAPAATTTTGPPQRWFVVWLGTSNDPVDKGAAKALAESIQPWTAPPAAPQPGGAPQQPAPGAPAAPAPAPGQAPAGDATPAATPTPQRTLPTT